MKKNINKKIIKIVLVLVVFLLFIFNFSFASGTESSGGWGSDFGYAFMSLVDILWSVWYVFVIMAWKLLTNDFLYWTHFNLDVVLWHIWNFSRTLANFLIWFIFIYLVFRYILFFSEKDTSILKTHLPKLVIASILVNMSWFLIAVLIDISTIFIAAFGSLPSSLWISEPPLVLPKNTEISVQKCDPSSNPSCVKWSFNSVVKEKTATHIEDLQKYETSVSWPLMFLWTSVLNIWHSKNKLLNEAYDFKAKKFKNNGVAIKALLKLLLFILFLIPIIILIIVNVVRVFWIWLYIWFSPLLFLDWVFGKNKLSSANKAFAFKNAIWLIFSPALVVLSFSIWVILIIWVADALNTTEWTDKHKEEVKKIFMLWSGSNGVVELDFWKFQDIWSDSKYIWWFFGYLIVNILLIIFIWGLVKMSFKASEVTSGVSDSMFRFSENLMKTIPVPTPLGPLSYGSWQMLLRNIGWIPDRMVWKQLEQMNKLFGTKSDVPIKDYNDNIEKLKNIHSRNEALQNIFKSLEVYKDSNDIKTSPNAKKYIDALEKAILNSNAFSSIKSDLQTATTYKDKLKILLKNQTTILDHSSLLEFNNTSSNNTSSSSSSNSGSSSSGSSSTP